MASEAVLLLLLKLNLAGGAAILVVLALRRAIRNSFGARVTYALWLAVPAATTAVLLPAQEIMIAGATVRPEASAVPAAAAKEWLTAAAPAVAHLEMPMLILTVWIAGVVLSIGLQAWRQSAFRGSLGTLRRETKGVLRSDAAGIGPAIIGAIWPKIVLPRDFEARFDAGERDLVMAHERVHLRGRDPMINGLSVLAQCLNWFNPLMHIAAHAMRIDQELACDATVIAGIPKARRTYAEAMLKTQVAPMGLPVGCYWPAQSEHPLKLRIAMLKRDLPDKMRAGWGAVAAGIIVLGVGAAAWSAQPSREVETPSGFASSAQAARDTVLLRALQRGDSRRVEAALISGADVDARTTRGMTALVIAARSDDLHSVNLLLEHGADPNLVSPGEGNALTAAARRGHIRTVTALVEHGAQINTIAPDLGTPLVTAVRTSHTQVVKYLVEHGADVNLASPTPAPWDRLVPPRPPRSPLWWAVNSGGLSTADYLKSHGATM